MAIDKYEFSDKNLSASHDDDGNLVFKLRVPSSGCIAYREDESFILNKLDVIALAKSLKLTAHDIDCQAIKDMQDARDLADEIQFDEIVEIKANKIKTDRGMN